MMEDAKKLLKKYYGYPSFRPGQEKIIQSILQRKDTFAVMPTGAGKSICFQIPALLFEGITLVVSPLISLMKDQVDGLVDMGVPATFINSSLTFSQVQERIEKARNGEFKLLYIAPERLESFEFYNLLNSLEISLIAIDEAHCVSQWGHDFRPSYRSIAPLIRQLSCRPIISGFTATATKEVQEDVVSLLSLQEPNIYVTGFDRENLSFSVFRGENKRDFIFNFLKNHKEQVGIIYAATRKEVDRIYDGLSQKNYLVGRYHAGLSDLARKENQESFLYDDINIMVATNAFGMGIDKSNVRYVIHHNTPKNMESYYQEAGRAGRDGDPSECILLFSPQDTLLQKYMIEQNNLSFDREKNEYKKLQSMVDYCHTPKCLRKYILEYFGEANVADTCGNCSTCNDDRELSDITIEAQKIFSCIFRMKERFGTSLVTQVLRGSKNKKVLQFGFDKLSTYGIMKEYKEKEIKDLMNILIAEGYIGLTEGQYPIVKLREKAVGVLKNKEKVFQKIQRERKKVSIDNGLFDILRNLRKEISTRENVPPYIIFPDSTLREMSEYCPISEDELLSTKGVGERKFEKYGHEFLQTIKSFVDENDMVNRKEKDHSSPPKEENEKIPSYVITLSMYKEGKSLSEISVERQLKPITIQDHIIRCGLEGLDVNLDAFIPKEYEPLILDTIKKIGAQKLKPIKEELPDEVDYLAIKAVLCKHQMI